MHELPDHTSILDLLHILHIVKAPLLYPSAAHYRELLRTGPPVCPRKQALSSSMGCFGRKASDVEVRYGVSCDTALVVVRSTTALCSCCCLLPV